MIKIGFLGSGSDGNSTVISDGVRGVMVDVGFSRIETIRRMNSLGLCPEKLVAALLTHEHQDHSYGCRVFCNSLHIPLYASTGAVVSLAPKGALPENINSFEPGCEFEIGGFSVAPFLVSHDARLPVGYVIRRDGIKIGIATDLGMVTRLAEQRLRDSDVLVIESNYDLGMLSNSQRPLKIKRRIMSSIGHLCNRDTLNVLPRLITGRTRALMLAHISKDCNSVDLVRRLFASALEQMGRSDILVQVLPRNEVYGMLKFDDAGNFSCSAV